MSANLSPVSDSIYREAPQSGNSVFLPLAMVLIVIITYAAIDLFRPINRKQEAPDYPLVPEKNMSVSPSYEVDTEFLSPAPLAMPPEIEKEKPFVSARDFVSATPLDFPLMQNSLKPEPAPLPDLKIEDPITQISLPKTNPIAQELAISLESPSESDFERLGRILYDEIKKNGGQIPRQVSVTLEEGLFIESDLIGNETHEPSGCGCFTPWFAQKDLNHYILKLNEGHQESFWDRGHCISAVEGRLNERIAEYRLVYDQTPIHDPQFAWYYRISLTQTQFDRCLIEMMRSGFNLVQSQSYEDAEGTRRFQAVWHKTR